MKRTNDKQRRLSAFGISIVIHSLLLLFIATLTVDLTMPEGNVTDGSMEMGLVPRGSQVHTVNVDVTAQSEVPEMVKSKPAPPPPPPPPAPTVKEEAPVADEQGILPIKTGEESTQVNDLPPQEVTESPPETLIAPVPLEEPPQEMPEKVADTNPPVPGTSPDAAAPDQSGTDSANLKGQAEVSDQSYGRADGVTDDRILTPLAGNRRPKYPTMARFRRIEGKVEIHYEINPSGQVTKLQLVGSTNEIFNEDCIEAVKTWRFHAPVTAGWYSHVFNFSLKGNVQELPSRLRRKQ